MKQFIDKLIERLEEEKEYCSYNPKIRDEAINNAISIVNQLAEEYMTCYKSCTECEAYDKEKHYCPKWRDVIKGTVKEMEENHNGWIACSERLPELNEEVLVTQFFDDSKHYNVTNASLISVLDGSGRIRWCSYDHFITHVIAWQPLPAPYQPKGE